MRMQNLDSGCSVGAGTTGSGGILVSVWGLAIRESARALLTVREAEWLVEKLEETIQSARGEINGKCFVVRNPDLTSGQPGVS